MISEKDKYIFFIIAFDSAPNQRYLDQIDEAVDYGLSLKDLMKMYCDTGKPQFENIYPSTADDISFAKSVAERIISYSASEEKKYDFISDIVSALSIGWTRGEVLYTIFNNILSKGVDNKEWGSVIQKIDNKFLFSKMLVDEGISISATDSKLRWLIDGVDEESNDFSEILSEKNNNLFLENNIEYLDVSNNYNLSDEILSNHQWEIDEKIITYNFELDLNYFNKISNPILKNEWRALYKYEKLSVENAVTNFNKYLDVKIIYKSGSDSDINISASKLYYSSGIAYYPGQSDDAGDIWIDSDFKEIDYQKNGYGNLTVLHELGHAMGIQHTHESSLANTDYDRLTYSVMTYKNDKNNLLVEFSYGEDRMLSSSGTYIYASGLSIFDVQALQKIYGVNKSTNSSDNIYSIYFEDKDILTIWDAGGVDTIDISFAKGNSYIDLTPGTISSADVRTIEQQIYLNYENLLKEHSNEFFSEFEKKWLLESIAESFDYYNNDPEKIYTGKGNISIVDGAIIENVVLGLGNDFVKDNFVNNVIKTADGDDEIYLGSGGHDYIDGGEGYDVVYFNSKKEDVELVSSGKGDLLIFGDGFSAELIGIEKIIYSDGYLII